MFSPVARLRELTEPFKRVMVHFREVQHAANEKMPNVIPIRNNDAVQSASNLLLSGHVIALPTDTIYGIAASVQNSLAIKQLYEIKKRDLKKPIAICVGKIDDVHIWGETTHLPQGLIKSLLPGAVTIVLKRKDALNPLLNPDSDLVGIRIPKYAFIQDIAKVCNVPLALTSANLSSETSCLNIGEFQHLWPCLSAVFDGGTLGGTTSSREGSTVVDFSKKGCFKIVRPGSALQDTISVVKKYGLTQTS